ncbi:DUF2911 domain-containing protein [Winogradskyella vincentii]|uniref:DUF2911 domain-containing protein n=1 Tax=Winogradskyella vincentii TaxID=2877122 RepID=A0ABS7Y3U0_9FLAO|nr:DUF2911 domain-containing protein [Winogradskyella vincentii]MCA0153945.1 DUF2911 domain-containing protein [Winogradskyella vincentii]
MRATITSLLLCAVLSLSLTANAQLFTPRGSQMASVMQRVGTTDITITYSRPSVNEREIWGKLVPFGLNNLGFGTSTAAPWRAGANENTTISFTHDVSIGGKTVPAGTYGLHINVKDIENATIILSKDTEAWGSYFYDPAKDVLQADVKLKDIPHTELLTFSFDEVSKNYAVASLKWEKKAIPFKIEVNVTDIVMDQIRSQLKGQKGFSRQNWEQAANFALNNGGDLDEALTWINGALEGNFFSEKTVNGLATKAQILMKKGDKAGFGATMDEASTMANANQLNRMGNYMLSIEDYDRALKYYNMNLKDDPKNPTWHNSVAAAYKAKGNTKTAIKHYKKALALKPSDQDKARSEKALKELGAM